ncbi:TetR/AcrR family transcriptional regulator [Micromonospora sp. CPCC 206060]|uniref:TetR/AcrR family transcriptional regulator n=1 Tax=Micromonospora sp. CPCC 206060 TaxID=3122406 RepID=UPI002FF0EB1D
MPTGVKRSSYHHGSLREALLDGARTLLAERGSQGFSLNELARRVGVSSAAPYRHFVDRDALLGELADQGYLGLRTALEETERPSTTPADRIRRMGVAYLRFAADNPAVFGIMFQHRPGHEKVRPLAFQPLVDVVGQAQEHGDLPDHVPPGVVARTIWATVHGLATLQLGQGFVGLGLEDSTENLVDQALTLLLRRPRPGG